MHLTKVGQPKPKKEQSNGTLQPKGEAYVGWTGMASASSLAQFQSGATGEKGLETIEIDPQYAGSLGFAEGDTVRLVHLIYMPVLTSR